MDQLPFRIQFQRTEMNILPFLLLGDCSIYRWKCSSFFFLFTCLILSFVFGYFLSSDDKIMHAHTHIQNSISFFSCLCMKLNYLFLFIIITHESIRHCSYYEITLLRSGAFSSYFIMLNIQCSCWSSSIWTDNKKIASKRRSQWILRQWHAWNPESQNFTMLIPRNFHLNLDVQQLFWHSQNFSPAIDFIFSCV